MDTLTATTLAEVLQEPEKALLALVLRTLGQERCAAILADTLTIESNGGMLVRAGDRRRTPGVCSSSWSRSAALAQNATLSLRSWLGRKPRARCRLGALLQRLSPLP